MYNKMAKTLVEFETLWYQAWVGAIETSKNGLTATLIVRHPEDSKLHVNFEREKADYARDSAKNWSQKEYLVWRGVIGSYLCCWLMIFQWLLCQCCVPAM